MKYPPSNVIYSINTRGSYCTRKENNFCEIQRIDFCGLSARAKRYFCSFATILSLIYFCVYVFHFPVPRRVAEWWRIVAGWWRGGWWQRVSLMAQMKISQFPFVRLHCFRSRAIIRLLSNFSACYSTNRVHYTLTRYSFPYKCVTSRKMCKFEIHFNNLTMVNFFNALNIEIVFFFLMLVHKTQMFVLTLWQSLFDRQI